MKIYRGTKCTDKLYDNLKAFQDGRVEARQRYEKQLKTLESAKGSTYYEEETQKAFKACSDALAALKSKYESAVFMWLDEMDEVNKSRSFDPITESDKITLDMVRARIDQGGDISESELDMLCNSLSDNPMARKLFEEYAEKAGIIKSYAGEQPPTLDFIRNIIQGLRTGAREFIESDEEPRVAHVMRARANLYGDNGEAIPKRQLFTDKAGMFRELSPTFNMNVSEFCECVD